MAELEQASTLIGDIYDAALDPALWSPVLQRLANFVGGRAAALCAKDVVRETVRFVHVYGVEPEFVQSYFDRYASLDPSAISRFFFPVEQVFSTTDIMPHEEFRETIFFKEWVRPQGWIDFVSALLAKSQVKYVECVVFRHESDGTTDGKARHTMKLIVPHLRRAVLISEAIDLRKVETARLADTLDGIAAALFLVDADGHIVHANVSGHQMLKEGHILRSVSGKLGACNQNSDHTIRQAIAVAGGDDIKIDVKGIAVSLVGPKSEPYIAHVLPLSSGARREAGVAYSAVAAVFVRKAMLDLLHPMEALANFYKLTPTELRVLMAVIQVGGVLQAADVLGISQATVKTHLSRLFEKTSTNRQADLVRIVASFATPFITSSARLRQGFGTVQALNPGDHANGQRRKHQNDNGRQ
jgi:DNA-binding CsgD family transcriptional regulator